MPFNPVYNLKAANLWRQALTSLEEQRVSSKSEPPLLSLPSSTSSSSSSSWLFFFFSYLSISKFLQSSSTYIAFWSVFLYVVGSVIYLADSFLLWPRFNPDYSDDGSNPAIYLNTFGAIIFAVDASACFLDWHVQVQQIRIAEKIAKGDTLSEIAGISQTTSWLYFYNNIFFLAAAMIYLVQALWYRELAMNLTLCREIICDAFWVNFFGGLFYLASSYFTVLEYFEYQKMRRKQKLPPMLLLTSKAELFDWFGWGDWLYVLASMLSFIQSFFVFTSIGDDANCAFNVIVNVVFLVDSLAYFLGYLLFMQELRGALKSGKVSPSQAALIRDIITSNNDEDTDCRLCPMDDGSIEFVATSDQTVIKTLSPTTSEAAVNILLTGQPLVSKKDSFS